MSREEGKDKYNDSRWQGMKPPFTDKENVGQARSDNTDSFLTAVEAGS